MTPLVRYLLSDVLRTQRWTAPLLAFLAVSLIIGPPTGPVLPTYAMAAAALVPIGMWVTVVVMHNEEPMQGAITMAVNGGFTRVWLAKVVAAFVCTAVLGLASLTWLTLSSVQFDKVGIGAVDFLMTAVTGVAFGTLISRPVMPKIAWTVLIGLGICLAQLFIRQAPPMNALIDLYAGDKPGSTGTLALIAVESFVLSVLVVVLAHRVARTRV